MVAKGDGRGPRASGRLEDEGSALARAAVALEPVEGLGRGAGDEGDVEGAADRLEEVELDPGATRGFAIDVDGNELEGGKAATGDGVEEVEEGEGVFAAAEGDRDLFDPFDQVKFKKGLATEAFEPSAETRPGGSCDGEIVEELHGF